MSRATVRSHLGTVLGVKLFFHMARRPRLCTLFPYTTLFRSASPSLNQKLKTTPSGKSPWTESIFARFQGIGVYPETSVAAPDRKSTRLNSSHTVISYAVVCLKKKTHSSSSGSPERARETPVL